MAVYEPGAGIIGFECDDYVAVFGEEDDVAAGWVVEFEGGEGVDGEGLVVNLGEDGEVVAVEMDLWC